MCYDDLTPEHMEDWELINHCEDHAITCICRFCLELMARKEEK